MRLNKRSLLKREIMRHIFVLIVLCCSVGAVAQSKKELAAQVESLKKENDKLKTDIAEMKKPKVVPLTDTVQMVSYSLGALMANNLKSQGGDSLKLDGIAEGFKDVFQGADLKIKQEDGMPIVQAYMQRVALEKMNRTKAENEAFLEKNKTAAGVVTTASGLQYKVITSGKGKMPKATDNVTVHYTGTLIDGTVFDSSRERNEPATFNLNGIIEGWTEALQLMHEGDRWTLYLPSSIGYGDRGAGSQIPPYSTLIFDVELIKVN